jgi:hypothetical protein
MKRTARADYTPECFARPPQPRVYALWPALLTGVPSSLAYMISVRIVSFCPLSTSSPEWRRSRCWNKRTRPHLGATSIRFSMFQEKKVVAPPSSGSCPSLPLVSLRYRCRVKYDRSVRSGVSYVPSQCAVAVRAPRSEHKVLPTFEILATDVLQETCAVIQSRHFPHLFPFRGSTASNAWPVF